VLHHSLHRVLDLVESHIARIQSEEGVRIAPDDIRVGAAIQVKDFPGLGQATEQGRLAALPDPQEGDAGKPCQIGV